MQFLSKEEKEKILELFAIQSWVESAWNKKAIRFEKHIMDKVEITLYNPKMREGISNDTFKAILSTSYGLPQLIGFNIARIYQERRGYDLYGKTLWQFIADNYLQSEGMQIDYWYYFCRHIITFTHTDLIQILRDIRNNNKSLMLLKFARLYNGSFEYAELLLSAKNVKLNDFLKKFPEAKNYLF
jgi:hypothetical protein